MTPQTNQTIETPKKILVGVNSLTEIQWQAYNTHIQFFYRLGKDFPDMQVAFVNPSRYSIDKMRNMCCTIAVNQDFDYVLFLDDDVLPPSDALQRLLACNSDIAAGDVIIRGYPFNHMCFQYTNAEKNDLAQVTEYPEGQHLSVDAVGCSLTLIKVSFLKKMTAPYFITGLNCTEDIYFCLKARDLDPDCTITVDTKLTCGHILWPEVMSSLNKKDYKGYFEKQNPSVLKIAPPSNLRIERVGSDISYEDVVRNQMKDGLL